MENSLEPCHCGICNGKSVSQRTKRAHAARELRRHSARSSSFLNGLAATTFHDTPAAAAAAAFPGVSRLHANVNRRETQKRVSFATSIPGPPTHTVSPLPARSVTTEHLPEVGQMLRMTPLNPNRSDAQNAGPSSSSIRHPTGITAGPSTLLSDNGLAEPDSYAFDNSAGGFEEVGSDGVLPLRHEHELVNRSYPSNMTLPATYRPSDQTTMGTTGTSSLAPRPQLSQLRPAANLATFRSAAPIIALEELRGRQHVTRVGQSDESFVPIADDDWELESSGSDAEDPGASNMAVQVVEDMTIDNTGRGGTGVGADGDDTMTDQTASTTDGPSDPFRYTPRAAHPPITSTPAAIHENRAVPIIYLLVLWLHRDTQFHLAFRACAAVLVVFSLAFAAAGSPIQPPMVTTLPSVISKLDAEAFLKIYPVCPKCLKVFHDAISRDATCDICGCPLFQSKQTPSGKKPWWETQEMPKPHLQFPAKSIEDYLTTMLAVPGMEEEMIAWQKKTRTRGEYTDIFDGDICQTIEGVDGSPFFYPQEGVLDPDELRIGVSLGADW